MGIHLIIDEVCIKQAQEVIRDYYIKEKQLITDYIKKLYEIPEQTEKTKKIIRLFIDLLGNIELSDIINDDFTKLIKAKDYANTILDITKISTHKNINRHKSLYKHVTSVISSALKELPMLSTTNFYNYRLVKNMLREFKDCQEKIRKEYAMKFLTRVGNW